MRRSAFGLEARRQWPLWAIAGVSFAWFLYVIVASWQQLAWLPSDFAMPQQTAAIFPPLIVLLLIAAFMPLGRASADVESLEQRIAMARRMASEVEDQLYRIDTVLGQCADKVETMRLSAAAEGNGLVATAETMEVTAGTMAVAAADMGRAASRLVDTVPDLAVKARDAGSAMRAATAESLQQIDAVERALATLADHSRAAGADANASVKAMESVLAQIDQTSSETTKAIANRAYTLDAAVTGVLERSAAAFETVGEKVGMHGRNLEALIARARSEIDNFGAEGTRAVSQRLDVLLGAAGQLKQLFLEHQSLSDTLGAQVTLKVAESDAQITGLRSRQQALQEALEAQIAASAKAFEQRLEGIQASQREADERLHDGAAGTIAALGVRLEALRAGQRRAGDDIRQGLEAELAAIETRLGTLRAQQGETNSLVAVQLAEGLAALEAHLDSLRGRQQAAGAELGEATTRDIAALGDRFTALRETQRTAGETMQADFAASLAAIEQTLGETQKRQEAASEALTRDVMASVQAFDMRLLSLAESGSQADAQMRDRMAASMAAAEAQLAALTQRQQAAGATLEETASAMTARLTASLAKVGETQTQLTTSLLTAAAEAVSEAENRFQGLQQSSDERLAELREAIARTLGSVASVGDALGERQQAAAMLEAKVNRLLPALSDFAEAANSRLPALSTAIDDVADRGRAMTDQLEALADRVESQAALLRDSAAAFERDHESVVGLSETLTGKLGEARAIVHDIEASTEQTGMAAAARMVENVMQVRQSVNATSEEIRSLLDKVLTEASQTLDAFAFEKAEAALGAPIRLHLAALEDATTKAADAASEASDRMTTRLVDLMRTIAETEARVDEVDTRMDVRARATLAGRSTRLVDSLNSASVDVARLLSVDVGDDAWARYLGGDRGLFARATVRIGDKDTARKIARHFAHDSEFAVEATRYMDQFEELMRRVLKDPDGDSFGLVLLSSDIGKLYVLMAEAVGRTLARAA